MAAAAYKGTLTLRNRNSGRRLSYLYTGTDVADAFITFDDGGSVLQLPTDGEYEIIDLTLSAAGTDTSQSLIYANAQLVPVRVQNAVNLTTTINRQFNLNPVAFKPGAQIRFQQKA